MIFAQTQLPGVYVIDPEPRADERGFLARTFCVDEFAQASLNTQWVQCSTVFNHKAGTLRGMHYQAAPHGEIKLIRCTAGAVYDVALDVRPHSPTYRQWVAVELSAANRRAIYIPEGVAHGMQTLTDDAELFYMMSAMYHAESARGLRWDDPAFAIEWPQITTKGSTRIINAKDAAWEFVTP